VAVVKRYDRNTEAVRRKEKEIYSDFFRNLNIHPEKRDVARHVNEYAIAEALKNLILTNKGERFFNNGIGTDVDTILFENVSPFMMSALNTLITTAVKNFEPRAIIQSVKIDATADNNSVSVSIVFSIATNTEPVRLNFILDRVR
jgi:phage baseplate assembly protein W